jgi:hypothetical protein
LANRTLLIDANVLLLLLVGLYDKARIPTFKNTAHFTVDDFDDHRTVQRARRYAHVLTEVSNLAGQMGEPIRSRFFEVLQREFAPLSESHVDAKAAVADSGFVRLGLTDAGITTLARSGTLAVLTADLDLWVHLIGVGVDATNFNHLRNVA